MACVSHHRGPAGLPRHGAGAGGRTASLMTAFLLSVLFFAIPAGASDAAGLGIVLAAGGSGPLAAGPGEAGLSDVRPVEAPGDARYPGPDPDAAAVGNVSGRLAIGPSQGPVLPKMPILRRLADLHRRLGRPLLPTPASHSEDGESTMASRIHNGVSFKTTAAGGGDCDARLDCIRRRLAAGRRPGLLAMLVASVLCQGQMCGPAPAPLPSSSDQASPGEQVLGSAPPAAPSQGGGAAPMVASDLVVDAGADAAARLPDAVVQLQAVVRTAEGSEPAGLGYRWSVESAPGAMAFGDPGGRQTSASFQASGRYVLRFEVWDGAGGQVAGSDTVVVLVYPEIRFSVDPGSDRGLQMPVTAVCAAATADGSPLPDGLYVWSIEPPGGGSAMSETGAFLAKRLNIPGRYAFTLTATLAGLAPFACSSADAPESTRITRDYGNPGGPVYTGPAASFLATSPTAGVAPLTVGFDAGASTGAITQYIWQFQGEGAAGTGVRPSHTYTQPGEYDVTLTVMDAEGRSDVLTKQAFVRVYAPEAPVVPLITAIEDHAVSDGTPYERTPELIQGTAPVTWSLAAGPAGMTIDPGTGVVRWGNPSSQGSPHTVTIRASNAAGSDDESWLLTVNTVAVAPVIADIPDASHTAGSAYTGPQPALTAGTTPVTWSLVSGPAGMTISSLGGRVNWAIPTTAGSPHTITIRASNAAGSDDETWQLTVNAAPPTWQNTSFATQAGQFSAEFDATPGQSGMDGVIGLSQNAASAYTQLAAIVRFNTSGTIDVRNGGAYQAAATLTYAAGTSYHFRMVVDVPAKRYSVYVRPQGAGAETTLAVDYAFRTEQSGVGLLNNFARCVSVGSMQVSSPTIVAAPATPLIVTNTNSVIVPEGGTGTFQVRLSAAPASNVTVNVSRSGGDADIAVQSGAALTFTPANYATYQTVTLAAAEDADTTNGQATIRCSATGLANRDVTATEADNDAVPVTIQTNVSDVSVPEGATGTFQVRLSAAPASNVTVNVSRSGGDADIAVQSGAALTFTPANYATYQTVTLAAAEDADTTNGQATIRCSATGLANRDVTATEADNDAAGGTLVVSAGPDKTINQGQSVTLDATVSGGVGPYTYAWAPVQYSWTPVSTIDSPGALRPSVHPDGTATYVLTVTDHQGQQASDEVTVKVFAAQLEQYGITWTFDQAYQVGHFVTGDWWVVGPVTVTAISPAPAGGRNGSMINPVPGNTQAYDDRNFYYNASDARTPPFEVSSGSSLVSTESLAVASYVDLIGTTVNVPSSAVTKSAAILTCVPTVPPEGAFRPPYVGSVKTLYLESEITWGRLPSLPRPSSAPSIAAYASYLRRPWIDHLADWPSRQMHPADNMPNYGREIAGVLGDAACLLCCDYDLQHKRPLAIGLIQIGIDNYHTALMHKHMWPSNGGQMLGRKLPILFAGLMLNRSEILTLDEYDVHEDLSTYYGQSYGESLWTGWQDSGHPYASNAMWCLTPADSLDTQGNPWRHEHRHPSTWGSAPFPNTGGQYPYVKHDQYRRICAFAVPGQTIAARILGLKDAWNHPAYFDYVDRWMYEDDVPIFATIKQLWPSYGGPYNGGTAWSPFARDMYLQYRSLY